MVMKNLQKLWFHPISRIMSSSIIILFTVLVAKTIFSKTILPLFSVHITLGKSIQGFVTFVVLLVSYYFLMKKFEKRNIDELSSKIALQHSLLGFLTGFGMISLIFLLLYLFGYYRIQGINSYSSLFETLIFFTLLSAVEEVIFRGLLYRITENWLGTHFALLISALIFSFMHITNDHMNITSIIAIIIAGLLLGILFSLTKSLWFLIFFHMSWNYGQNFYGTPVSGGDFSSFLQSTLSGPALMTGKEFGPENSIITISLCFFLFLFCYYKTIKSNKLISSSRKSKK